LDVSVKKLAEAISTESSLMEKLKNLLEREMHALSGIKIESLDSINSEKEALLAEMLIAAASLRSSVDELAGKHALPASSAFDDIVKASGVPELSRLREILNAITEKTRNQAELNREIAERFAETASSTLNILTGLINQTNLYGANGGYQQRQTGSIMINREA